MNIKNVKAERSNFKHFFFLKKCLNRYTFWFFIRINFAALSLLPLGQSQVCIFLQFIEALGMFLCNKFNHHQ